jgi:hypothetical protein
LHGLIYRHLVATLGEPARRAGSYMSAFDGRAGLLMRQLADVLEATARRIAIADAIVAAAKEAFRIQHQWYSCDLLPTPHQTHPTVPSRAA